MGLSVDIESLVWLSICQPQAKQLHSMYYVKYLAFAAFNV